MPTLNENVDAIRMAHRQRRFAMKIQQKLDRALESHIRTNATTWRPDMDEADRKKINAEVRTLIDGIRSGKIESVVGEAVRISDAARAPADQMRKDKEAIMEGLAELLPVWSWCESIRGIGALGLATIVAEAGDLGNYANVAKLWKRLGYAPYGDEPGTELAGSTWKRESWRPRALTKEEWIAHPFSGERYSLMFQIALWLRNAQWIGKSKTEDGKGKPNGAYGEAYAARRARTAVVHPDWTDGHADKDALRILMKTFLRDLWVEWHRIAKPETVATILLEPMTKVRPSRPASTPPKTRRQMPGAPTSRKRKLVGA